MAATKKINPILKLVLEIGPILVFFLVYRLAPVAEGVSSSEAQLSKILFATAVFIPVILITLAASWVLTRHLPRMAVITAILVVVFGGLTLWLRDDTFIKMKPTILYLMFAAGLGFGLMRGESYLKYLMDDMMPLQDEGWMKFTKRFALFFLVLAGVNEVVWRSMDTDAWVNFRTFVLPIASFAFVISQASIFVKYAIDEPDENDG
jgi:intracellular septation protein